MDCCLCGEERARFACDLRCCGKKACSSCLLRALRKGEGVREGPIAKMKCPFCEEEKRCFRVWSGRSKRRSKRRSERRSERSEASFLVSEGELGVGRVEGEVCERVEWVGGEAEREGLRVGAWLIRAGDVVFPSWEEAREQSAKGEELVFSF